jgi:hypothetical protein
LIPISTIARVARLALLVKKKLEESGKTARLRDAVEVEQRSWGASRDAKVEELLAATASSVEELAAQIAEMLSDRQFMRLQRNMDDRARLRPV